MKFLETILGRFGLQPLGINMIIPIGSNYPTNYSKNLHTLQYGMIWHSTKYIGVFDKSGLYPTIETSIKCNLSLLIPSLQRLISMATFILCR